MCVTKWNDVCNTRSVTYPFRFDVFKVGGITSYKCFQWRHVWFRNTEYPVNVRLWRWRCCIHGDVTSCDIVCVCGDVISLRSPTTHTHHYPVYTAFKVIISICYLCVLLIKAFDQNINLFECYFYNVDHLSVSSIQTVTKHWTERGNNLKIQWDMKVP